MEVIVSAEYPELVWVVLTQGESLEFSQPRPRITRITHRGAKVEICLTSDALDAMQLRSPKVNYRLHIPSLDEKFSGTYGAITREEALRLIGR